MATKRRKLSARPVGISAAAIEAWRQGAWMPLDRALGLRPWQINPLDAVGDPPPADGTHWAASWPRAVELRRALEVAG
jgi:hypothetical protein